MNDEEKNVEKRSVVQWISDQYEHCKKWLYRALSFEQLDRWILRQVFFPVSSSLGVYINTVFGVILINTILDQIKPITWELLVEITKAATPYLGVTAVSLLNHTVQLTTAFRNGLVKK